MTERSIARYLLFCAVIALGNAVSLPAAEVKNLRSGQQGDQALWLSR